MAERQVIVLGRNCHLAESYVTGSAREAGAAAELAARRKSMPTLAVSTSSLQSRLKPWDL